LGYADAAFARINYNRFTQLLKLSAHPPGQARDHKNQRVTVKVSYYVYHVTDLSY
jgi:hypothetical protein